MSTVVNRPSGRTPRPTNLGHLIQFRLTTSLKAYLIPPGYEAKLRPSALLSYKGKRCSPLHKRTAGLFDSVASAPESFQNFLFLCVLPLEETPYITTVFVVVVYRPLGELPGPHIWAMVQFRQQTPMTDMGSLCHANAHSVSLL